MNRPVSCVNLNKAIARLAGKGDPIRLSRALANVVVGQMLPDGVVKGGSSLMFRFGADVTRYTRDLDAARSIESEDYVLQLSAKLSEGWNGFTGRLVAIAPPHPKDVPEAYIMTPYDVKIDYCGKPWQTVRLEIGHNEIGDADVCEEFLPAELGDAFERLGFPHPEPLRVMTLPFQIAQKLHAVSEPGSERAHDLIDLQLVMSRSSLDLAEIRQVCVRLFTYRKRHAWPPIVMGGEDWDSVYCAALETIRERGTIAPKVDQAIAWANDLIARIDAAR